MMMINGQDCRAALAYLRSVSSPSLEIALGIAARREFIRDDGDAVADLIAVLEHLDQVATRVIELQGELMTLKDRAASSPATVFLRFGSAMIPSDELAAAINAALARYGAAVWS